MKCVACTSEINAVDSEHGKNLKADNWRINMVDKLESDPRSPYHKFSTGESLCQGGEPRGDPSVFELLSLPVVVGIGVFVHS